MKTILILPFLLISAIVMAQAPTPSGMTKINSRYDWLSGKFGSLTFPAGGTTPTTFSGPLIKGDVFWDSVGAKLRIFDGAYWHNYPDSVYATVADSLLVVKYGTRLDTLKIKANGGGSGSSKINGLLAADGTNTIDNLGFTQTWRWNSLGGSSGTGLILSSAASSSITNAILSIQRTGSNSGAIIGVGLDITNTATGASSQNVGLRVSASGAASSSAIIVPVGNVGIGNSTPATSAILDVASTTQGMLAPRMNTTQQNAIASPATGLLIYNTDSAAFRYYNGSAWASVGVTSGLTGTGDHNLKKVGGNINTNKTTQTLTDGATITWNTDNGYNAQVTLGGNRTLSITNAQDGDYGTLKITQDGTGNRTLAVPNGSINISPTALTTTIIGFYYDGISFYWSGGYYPRVDTIYRTVGKDSIQFTIDGRYHAILDSAGAGGGGGGTPGGSNTQVQYNNSSAFGGISGATSDGTNLFVPTLYGGSGSAGSLTLSSTTNATKGNIVFGTTSKMHFDEANTELRIGNSSDLGAYQLQVNANAIFGRAATNSVSAFTNASTTGGSSQVQLTQSDNTVIATYTGYDPSASGTIGGISLGGGAGFASLTGPLFVQSIGHDMHFVWNNSNTPGMTILGASGKVGINNTSPASTFDISGSFSKKVSSTATGVTLDDTYATVKVTATGQTITLPTAASITGRIYTIKLTASGSCTVATTSSQTIDGATTYSLSAQWKYVSVQSDGSNWMIIANNGLWIIFLLALPLAAAATCAETRIIKIFSIKKAA